MDAALVLARSARQRLTRQPGSRTSCRWDRDLARRSTARLTSGWRNADDADLHADDADGFLHRIGASARAGIGRGCRGLRGVALPMSARDPRSSSAVPPLRNTERGPGGEANARTSGLAFPSQYRRPAPRAQVKMQFTTCTRSPLRLTPSSPARSPLRNLRANLRNLRSATLISGGPSQRRAPSRSHRHDVRLSDGRVGRRRPLLARTRAGPVRYAVSYWAAVSDSRPWPHPIARARATMISATPLRPRRPVLRVM